MAGIGIVDPIAMDSLGMEEMLGLLAVVHR
jgi:hypothetical protein